MELEKGKEIEEILNNLLDVLNKKRATGFCLQGGELTIEKKDGNIYIITFSRNFVREEPVENPSHQPATALSIPECSTSTEIPSPENTAEILRYSGIETGIYTIQDGYCIDEIYCDSFSYSNGRMQRRRNKAPANFPTLLNLIQGIDPEKVITDEKELSPALIADVKSTHQQMTAVLNFDYSV